ncbi:MAG: hypothetical protein GQ545_10565 [Candidatus Aminicenantes bacterium]|jgi:hypothetical protein|nr:hypothetical protein [Candidatus Aminicenantes bacterium]
MTKDWKENLASFFEGYRIIERSKVESIKNFDQFCEFVVEPAFESLGEELENYRINSKIKKNKGKSITFQINFTKSRVDNFLYTIGFPKNSLELQLKLFIKGRKDINSPMEETESRFMKDVPPSEILKLKKEDLIQDVIEYYRNFCFKTATHTE